MHDAGIDHAGDGVVPQILLVGGPGGVGVIGIGIVADQVPRMSTADPGGFHAPVGGKVRGPQGQPLHPWRCTADGLDVGHPAGGFQDRVHQ